MDTWCVSSRHRELSLSNKFTKVIVNTWRVPDGIRAGRPHEQLTERHNLDRVYTGTAVCNIPSRGLWLKERVQSFVLLLIGSPAGLIFDRGYFR